MKKAGGKPDMRTLAVRVPEPLLVKAKIAAAKRRVTLQDLVADALNDFLRKDREGQK
jgi:hypothetical protein